MVSPTSEQRIPQRLSAAHAAAWALAAMSLNSSPAEPNVAGFFLAVNGYAYLYSTVS